MSFIDRPEPDASIAERLKKLGIQTTDRDAAFHQVLDLLEYELAILTFFSSVLRDDTKDMK